MRATCLFLLLVAACSGPGREADGPAGARGRTNMKGWELYCRKGAEDSGVTFALLPGTNRLKTIEEVESARETAEGLAGARRLLGTLAPGQTVVCRVPPGPGAEEQGFFVPFHDSELGKSLEEHARDCGVEIGMATW